MVMVIVRLLLHPSNGTSSPGPSSSGHAWPRIAGGKQFEPPSDASSRRSRNGGLRSLGRLRRDQLRPLRRRPPDLEVSRDALSEVQSGVDLSGVGARERRLLDARLHLVPVRRAAESNPDAPRLERERPPRALLVRLPSLAGRQREAQDRTVAVGEAEGRSLGRRVDVTWAGGERPAERQDAPSGVSTLLERALVHGERRRGGGAVRIDDVGKAVAILVGAVATDLVAGVADPVAVVVLLAGVGDRRAVVGDVADAVAVAVRLIRILHERAV